MIRRQANGEFWLIAQHEHALLSGRLAAHVGTGVFPKPAMNRPFVLGVGLHDCGWPGHDDEPTVNEKGWPRDVFESTPEVALKVWADGAQKAAGMDAYGGLLVSLHVMGLSRMAMAARAAAEPQGLSPRRVFEVNKFQHKQVELQEALRKRLGMQTQRPLNFGLDETSDDPREQALVYQFRWLQALDQISLAACCTAPPMEQTTPVPAGPGKEALPLAVGREGNDVIVAPWPFDQEHIECRVPYRSVEARGFASDEEFREAYRRAHGGELKFQIRR